MLKSFNRRKLILASFKLKQKNSFSTNVKMNENPDSFPTATSISINRLQQELPPTKEFEAVKQNLFYSGYNIPSKELLGNIAAKLMEPQYRREHELTKTVPYRTLSSNTELESMVEESVSDLHYRQEAKRLPDAQQLLITPLLFEVIEILYNLGYNVDESLLILLFKSTIVTQKVVYDQSDISRQWQDRR